VARNKNKNLSLLMGGFTCLFVLSSCLTSSGASSHVYLEGTPLTKKDYSTLTYHDFAYQSQGGGLDSLPSKGQLKTLVLPIAFTDFSFSKSELDDLAIAFNGVVNSETNETKYWQSVSSFYQTSSFGNVTLTSTIASPFETGLSAADFMKQSAAHSLRSTDVLRDAVMNYKTETSGDCKDFDSDGNGFIDAVYLIYACPDYKSYDYTDLSDQQKEKYWAYTSWDNRASSDKDSPVGNAYTWASLNFIYKGVAQGHGVDAHTFIHETGHLFGLDDYYSYTPMESNYTNAKYKYFDPTGGLDMMDCNVLDHNMWSKFALGWAKPYVIDSLSAATTVELKDSSSSGDFLLLPTGSYNGTAFDEYLMVELYVPTGLNSLDAQQAYANSYPQGFFIPGLKITHIDARIAHFTSASSYDYTVDVGDKSFLKNFNGSSSYFRVAASNSPDKSVKEGYRLIHLLEANGVNTFANLNYAAYQSNFYANNGTLFQGEDGRDSFSMTRFASFFEENEESMASSSVTTLTGLFNNGKRFPYSIRVNSIQSENGSVQASFTIALA